MIFRAITRSIRGKARHYLMGQSTLRHINAHHDRSYSFRCSTGKNPKITFLHQILKSLSFHCLNTLNKRKTLLVHYSGIIAHVKKFKRRESIRSRLVGAKHCEILVIPSLTFWQKLKNITSKRKFTKPLATVVF